MPQQQSPELSFADRMRRDANIVANIAGVFAAFGEVLLRKGMGERYFSGFRHVAVVPLLLFFPIFFPYEDSRGLLICVPIYLLLCFRQRLSIMRHRSRRLRGIEPQIVHSHYNGIPRLAKNFPKLSESNLKRFTEPAFMFACGLGLMIVSVPLGWFLLWSAVGMFAHANLIHARDDQRTLDMTDAALDSEFMADSFRQARGEPVRVHRR